MVEGDELGPLKTRVERHGRDARGIYLHAVANDFIMQVRPGRLAGHPDIPDHLALMDLMTRDRSGGNPAHMAVSGLHRAAVPYADIATITTSPAGDLDGAVARRIDGRPGGNREIDAFVHARISENRVHPHAEAGGEARAVDRRAQQAFAHALAVGTVEIDAAVGTAEAVNRMLLARERQLGKEKVARMVAALA